MTIPGDITEIKPNAFYAISGLESITLPENVTSVGIRAFGSGRKLTLGNSVVEASENAFLNSIREVYYYNCPPSSLSYSSFQSESTATLYIPQGSMDLFCSTIPWLSFRDIVEFDFSSIDEVEAVDGELTGDVYSTSGIMVRGGVKWAEWNYGLHPGIYIVRLSDGSVRKAVAK